LYNNVPLAQKLAEANIKPKWIKQNCQETLRRKKNKDVYMLCLETVFTMWKIVRDMQMLTQIMESLSI
jgi:hypothetical protein